MKKLLCMVLLLCAGLVLASDVTSEMTSASTNSAKKKPTPAQEIPNCLPFMRPDRKTVKKWIKAYEKAPRAYIRPSFIEAAKGAYSVLHHLDYIPDERNQECCGNCWAWAGTGCIEVALDVQEGIFDRLSLQYLSSCQLDEIGKSCCTAGNLNDVVDFYTATERVIPWDNIDPGWQDGGGVGNCPQVVCNE
ncbi:MAG: C1 family peptidase, partial [bacterium]